MTAAGPGVVGRDAELASVGGFLDRIPEGPTAHLLVGEAGIGKTTIWRRGVELAREHGLLALVARPNEAETRLPYAGLGDLLSAVDEREVTSLPAAQRHAIEVAVLRAEPGDEPLEQRAVGLALLALLGRLERRTPVLIAIDDSQWLDEPSASVLQFVARRLSTERVGLLVATRANDPGIDVLGIGRALPHERVSTAEVGALPRREVDRLLHVRLEVAVPESTLRRVHALSAGNPFFALEIGRALLRQGSAEIGGLGLPVPDTLRELVLERLYRLPGTTRDVLVVVAALARPTVDLVLASLDDDERTARSLARAEDAGVIELEDGVVRFSHPLLGSVLYGELPADARRRLHRRLAGLVGDPDERARHLAIGTVGTEEAVAAELEAAAARLRARGAPDAAGALADDARRLTPADRSADRARRTLAAADAYVDAGLSLRAGSLLEPLIDDLSDGPEQARALHILGRVRMFESGLLTAVPPLERAAAVAGDDPLLQTSIGRDLGIALSQTGDLAVAHVVAERTLDWAKRTGVPALTAAAGVHLASVEFLLGRGIRTDLLDAAEAGGRGDGGGSRPSDAGATEFVPVDLVRGAILKWSDRFDQARARFDAVRRQIVAAGDETAWIPYTLQAGELELWAGNWEAAARIADEGRVAAERRLPAMQQDHAYVVAAVEAHLGNVDAARAAAAATLAQAERTSDRRFLIRSHAVLGFLELSVGDARAALAQLERADELFRDASYGDPGVVRFIPELIEALVLRGGLDRATELQGWLFERGKTLDRPYALATAARSEALILASRSRVDDALAAVGEALREHERLPQPFELARTQLVHGTLLRRTKAKKEARAALGASLGTFERLGAAVWIERARSELARISGRAPTTTGLTPTEARIARLAADGYGNREIAETLVVSAKTVEAHLTRIYDKLEVRSRGELVRRSRSGEIPDFPGGSAA
jgi:DNA-binding CsgD family transcriptional regulator